MKTLQEYQQVLTEFSHKKVPMIGYCTPELIKINPSSCEIKIPLNNKTQNHVNSLYFGTLAIGADITSGFLAIMKVQATQKPIELLFKNFKADFKKKALADTHFHCTEGNTIQSMIEETLKTCARVNQTISVYATTPSLTQKDIVASFELTLSLKYKP